jgi:hypothetical protein
MKILRGARRGLQMATKTRRVFAEDFAAKLPASPQFTVCAQRLFKRESPGSAQAGSEQNFVMVWSASAEMVFLNFDLTPFAHRSLTVYSRLLRRQLQFPRYCLHYCADTSLPSFRTIMRCSPANYPLCGHLSFVQCAYKLSEWSAISKPLVLATTCWRFSISAS